MSFSMDATPNSNLNAVMINRAERQALGKGLRDTVPRAAQAIWQPGTHRTQVLSMLEESNRGRLPDLIPLRYARMLQSPLAFFRGSAGVMAADLATLPTTKLRLQSCGDCHLQNFGWFATPERNLIFDVTDFDESRTAPWEWDLKRLVASTVLAARQFGLSSDKQQESGRAVAQAYREHLTEYQQFTPLEMWYQRLDVRELEKHPSMVASRLYLDSLVESARKRTMEALFPKMTARVAGQLRFKDRPPLIFHPPQQERYVNECDALIRDYRQTLAEDRRVLLDRYRVADVVAKVVGVGSVGLRCGVVLLLDADESPLLLQIKEARASVLEPFVGKSERTHHGQRVVHGQRVMQAASDLFLGWASDSEGRCYYFRQLRDMKFSTTLEDLSPSEFREYAKMCGWGLARAHAKAGNVASIAGYLGDGDQFDVALGEFGMAYATQAEHDYEVLRQGAKSGRIPVATDSALSDGIPV
jgi:uncharacterized protein (DUF2252 family)